VSKRRPNLGTRGCSQDSTPMPTSVDAAVGANRTSALEENVQVIKRWERAILLARSKGEQLSDWIACTAGSGPVLILHVVWFAGWVSVNMGAIRGITPFDPFPFPFLTMTVSLEAIFLALFVLASQNRLALQADKRSHLDLQIDLLAEREMTAVLQLLQDIARHLEVETSVTPERLRDLMKKTDLHRLTRQLDELVEPTTGAATSQRQSATGESNGQEKESGTSKEAVTASSEA
jgi:uncharacterized membrane protein